MCSYMVYTAMHSLKEVVKVIVQVMDSTYRSDTALDITKRSISKGCRFSVLV